MLSARYGERLFIENPYFARLEEGRGFTRASAEPDVPAAHPCGLGLFEHEALSSFS